MSVDCCQSIYRVFLPAGSALLLLAAAPCAQAAVFTTLYSFGTVPQAGDSPTSGVIMDGAGNMYGETEQGGTSFLGSVYKLTPAGVMTTLYSFNSTAPSSQTGQFPDGGLSLDAGGNLYGTTVYGGRDRVGVAFKITPSGQEVVLHDFTSQDGYPSGGGVLDRQGDFTLATIGGQKDNGGSLLEFSPTGAETLLYRFQGGTDGSTPNGGLTLHKGALYGTTFRGAGGSGRGNVFAISMPDALQIRYHFRFYKDGLFPNGSLVFDPSGNLYGTTEEGGIGGTGTIFELAPSGRKTTLHVFKKSDPANNFPASGVVRDAAGNLYGTLPYGGILYCGLIYKLAPDGTYTVLYNFPASRSFGGSPVPSGLTIDAQGNLYGTTLEGGVHGDGSVFKLTP